MVKTSKVMVTLKVYKVRKLWAQIIIPVPQATQAIDDDEVRRRFIQYFNNLYFCFCVKQNAHGR